MANRWGIPLEVENYVKQRDIRCVYCGIEFTNETNTQKSKATWEHIINDLKINGQDNIALCCMSCNASKGAKSLSYWLKSDYCKKKGITFETVASIVQQAITNSSSEISSSN